MKSTKLKTFLKYFAVIVITALVTYFLTLQHYGGSELLLKALINKHYVEDVDKNILSEGAKMGMVNALNDEHSVYITSEYGFDYFSDSLSGEYVGIGATIQNQNKKAVIIEINDDSPAQKAGLKKGDIIEAVDDIPSKGSTLAEVTKRILGEEGTTVKISVKRNEQAMDFNVVRAPISMHTVSFEKLDRNTGYIQMSGFDVDTDRELIDALVKLSDCKKLIIDLRNNLGGYMDVAINTIDLFINDGVIVTAKYKDYENDYSATDKNKTGLSDEFLLKTPMAVIVNENSASASEIFSAALKDHGRAKIVGVNTYGKGSIQTTFSFKDNSGVKLTIGHFYSPNGTKIDKSGVKPDIEISLDEKYKNIGVPEIPRQDDLQLKAAIAALNK